MNEIKQPCRMYCTNFQLYIKWLFRFGPKGAQAVDRRGYIEGLTSGLKFAKIITEDQENMILRELFTVQCKHKEAVSQSKTKGEIDTIARGMVYETEKRIKVIFESKEESK